MGMKIIPTNGGGPGMEGFFKRVREWRLHPPPPLRSTAIPTNTGIRADREKLGCRSSNPRPDV